MVLKYRKDASSPWQEIQVLQGEQGPVGPAGQDGKDGVQGPEGPAGKDGSDYTITAADYQTIADVVLSQLPSAEGVTY